MTMPEAITNGGASVMLYRAAPRFNDHKTMAIGSIEFSSRDAGADLLQQIEALARQEGYQALLGPLDGDTWHKYRLIIKSDDSPAFMMEPTSGLHDLAAFEAAGYTPVSRYVSAIAQLQDTIGAQARHMDGITIEEWDGNDGDVLVRHLFEISTTAFAKNKFFTPISFDDFLAIYTPLLPFIQKEHVLFARDETGEIQGFLFGTPNFMDQSDARSVILKTYASKMHGLGHLLADHYHRRSIDMGFVRVIHALMHESNISRSRSEMHKARVFREYALMGKTL